MEETGDFLAEAASFTPPVYRLLHRPNAHGVVVAGSAGSRSAAKEMNAKPDPLPRVVLETKLAELSRGGVIILAPGGSATSYIEGAKKKEIE